MKKATFATWLCSFLGTPCWKIFFCTAAPHLCHEPFCCLTPLTLIVLSTVHMFSKFQYLWQVIDLCLRLSAFPPILWEFVPARSCPWSFHPVPWKHNPWPVVLSQLPTVPASPICFALNGGCEVYIGKTQGSLLIQSVYQTARSKFLVFSCRPRWSDHVLTISRSFWPHLMTRWLHFSSSFLLDSGPLNISSACCLNRFTYTASHSLWWQCTPATDSSPVGRVSSS